MRQSHTCPKCQHPEVLYLPEISDQADFPLTLHLVVRYHAFRAPSRWGKIEAYVCRGCGYTELYAADADKIPLDVIPGARLLQAKRSTPYR